MKLQDRLEHISNVTDVDQIQNNTFSSIHTTPAHPVSNPSHPMPYIFIKNGKVNERVDYKDILYLQAHGSYCKVVTNRKKRYTISLSLSRVMQKMNCPLLLRCHRSYAVHRDNIFGFDDSSIYILDGDSTLTLSLSDKYKQIIITNLNRLKC